MANLVSGSDPRNEGETLTTDENAALIAGVEAIPGTVHVLRTDASGNLKVNIAAGAASVTEYTEGDVDASITGSAVLAEAPSNTLSPLQLDANGNLKVLLVDSDPLGDLRVQGLNADGATVAAAGNPIVIATSDGVNVHSWPSDTNGFPAVSGVVAAGTIFSSAGNPVLVGGYTGTNTTIFRSDSSGRQMAVGAASNGATVTGSPVLIGASDGTNVRNIKADSSGNLVVTGAAADGAALAGNPVLIAGSDGANAQTLSTDSSGELQIDIVSIVPGTGATNLGKAEDAGHTTGDVGVMMLGVRNDNAATLAGTDLDYCPIATTAAGQVKAQVIGSVAHDTTDSGNPLKIGGQARTTDITAVADTDRVNAIYDTLGKMIAVPFAVPDLFVNGVATLTTTGDTAIIAATASVRNYITSISASNTSGTAVRVDFKDGTTVVCSFYLAASGGGAAQTFPVPIRGTANTAFNAALSGAVTDVRVSAQGYKAAN